MFLQIINISLQSNALWSSLTRSNVTELFNTYYKFINQINTGNTATVIIDTVKQQYSDPLLGTIIFIGVVPIGLSILSLVLCIPLNLSVIGCNRYHRYAKVQKKLDRQLVIYIKETGIQYNLNPKKGQKQEPMYDVCAVSPLGSKKAVKTLNTLHEQSDILYFRAFTCQCWSVTFYVIFFALLLCYLVTSIFLWIGMSKVTQLPKSAFDGVQSISQSIGKTTQSIVSTLDDQITTLVQSDVAKPVQNQKSGTIDKYTTGTKVQVFQALYSGTSQQYLANLTETKAQAIQMQQLSPICNSLNVMFEVNNITSDVNKSLRHWTNNLLFWPPSNETYINQGNEAAKYLSNGIYNMSQLLGQINNTKEKISNLSSNFTSNSNLQSAISNLSKVDIKYLYEYVSNAQLQNVIKNLTKSPELNKYDFADVMLQLVAETKKDSNITTFIDNFKELLINQTGTQSNSKKSVFEILKTIISNVDYINGTYLQDMLGKQLNNSKIFIDLSKYKQYIDDFYTFQSITLEDFISQLQNGSCNYLWCNKVSSKTFEDLNAKLKGIPVVGNLLAYNTSPSELLSNTRYVIFPICIIIPLAIMLSLGLTMGFCKTCCPMFSLYMCSAFSILISIFSIVFLIISLPNAGIIQSVSYKLVNQPSAFIDQLLPIGKQLGLNIPQSLNFSFPQIKTIKFEPQKLQIDLTNVNSALSSVNFNVSINITDVISISEVSKPLNKLLEILQFNISLNNMNVNDFFKKNKKQNLLNFIQTSSGPLFNDVVAKVKTIFNGINDSLIENIIDEYNITDKLDELFNVSQLINASEIFSKIHKSIKDTNITDAINNVYGNLSITGVPNATSEPIDQLKQYLGEINTSVNNMLAMLDINNSSSFGNKTQGNLETFVRSVLTNIVQTLQTSSSNNIQLVTVYDVLNANAILPSMRQIAQTILDAGTNAINTVISTQVTQILPESISGVGNSFLGSFDDFSIAAYFCFLFTFCGCQLCICMSFYFIYRYRNECEIKKRYNVQRPKFNCCNRQKALQGLGESQTKYDFIPRQVLRLYMIT